MHDIVVGVVGCLSVWLDLGTAIPDSRLGCWRINGNGTYGNSTIESNIIVMHRSAQNLLPTFTQIVIILCNTVR